MRRYDIDWVRVIAIGLLLIYHSAIAFQPWGSMIAFITNKEPWPALWLPMAILNVWRIPLLFFVSGMGMYFAMQSRTARELITERARRILLPFLFGIFFIVPIQIAIWRYYAGMRLFYVYDPSHLWFLGNIFAYVVIFAPLFFYLKSNTDSKFAKMLRSVFNSPLGILVVIAMLVAEAVILKPYPYELYAMTWHGFFLGLIAFFFGYTFAFTGPSFWNMLVKVKWYLLVIAGVLAAIRLTYVVPGKPAYMIPPETVCWILFILTLGYQYLNRPGKTLSYLSEAAYPVYIIHMIFQNLVSVLIFPMNLPVQIKYILLVLFTLTGCILFYEFVIRRVRFVRPLFGLKPEKELKTAIVSS